MATTVPPGITYGGNLPLPATFTIPATQHVQAQISLPEAIKLAVSLIDRAADLQGGDYINDQGSLAFQEEQSGGSHSWFEEQIVRPATDEDRAALLIIAKLRVLSPRCI